MIYRTASVGNGSTVIGLDFHEEQLFQREGLSIIRDMFEPRLELRLSVSEVTL